MSETFSLLPCSSQFKRFNFPPKTFRKARSGIQSVSCSTVVSSPLDFMKVFLCHPEVTKNVACSPKQKISCVVLLLSMDLSLLILNHLRVLRPWLCCSFMSVYIADTRLETVFALRWTSERAVMIYLLCFIVFEQGLCYHGHHFFSDLSI